MLKMMLKEIKALHGSVPNFFLKTGDEITENLSRLGASESEQIDLKSLFSKNANFNLIIHA